MPNSKAQKNNSLSRLPSVDEVLEGRAALDLIRELGREGTAGIVRSLIDEKRAALMGNIGGEETTRTREQLTAEITEKLEQAGAAARRTGVRRVINATGVVIHTNLGRAPLSRSSIEAMTRAAGYSAIEYDLNAGSRGPRGEKAVSLIKELTGAEDALVVNNCAAAAMMILSVFAQGGEVIVSRGELVEIGGDFRVPDVLTRSGAVLKEVGTTNRTHLRDYENAVSDRTAMILKVHPSNYRITGFTASVSTRELSGLARQKNILMYEDAGSGALIDLRSLGIKGEPVIGEVIADGADMVSFSGDKLLGGPQAGVIAGRAKLITQLRKDPFYRALRVDKTITAALESTLETYVRGTAMADIPVLRMLADKEEDIAERSARFAERLQATLGEGSDLTAVRAGNLSAVGGGASPDAALATTVIDLRHTEFSDSQLEAKLRSADPPVIARIEAGRVLLDLRTVSEDEESTLLEIISWIGR